MKSIVFIAILAGALVIPSNSSAADLQDSDLTGRAPYSFPSGTEMPLRLLDEKLQQHSTENSASPMNELEYSIIGSMSWSRTHDLISDSNYLYCTMPYGIIIYDISDPLNLVEVSRLFLGGAWDMVTIFMSSAVMITQSACLSEASELSTYLIFLTPP